MDLTEAKQRTSKKDKPAAQSSAAGPRLHAGHFAFMRAVIQGLDTRQSWDRYLRLEGEHEDIRNVRRTIQRIRDEFAAAARRHARHGIARLMQIDASGLQDRSGKQPTLEEFAAERGLEEFSQAEQLEYYREQFGAGPGPASRRRRVIARQLEALRWLEELVAVPPRPDDPPDFWLHPDLARRLEAAGLTTIESLVQHINGIGYRWWVGIPGIGAGKAERIVAWLRAQQAHIGLVLGVHVDLPRAQAKDADLRELVKRGAAVVPIEKFIPPPGLDGATGRFRASLESCHIGVNTDIEAVLAWVHSKPGASTRRSYLKEGERFLLWSVLERGKPLSSLDTDDCAAYLTFMSDPQPEAQWCGPRGREKWSPLWRPFEGPLSDAACRHAVVVLKNLFSFLVSGGYLTGNPWQDLALPSVSKSRRKDLLPRHWQRIEEYAGRLEPTSANARLMFALQLIRQTGLRLAEAVTATLDGLHETDGQVFLRITGRAGRQRNVPVAPELLDQLARYLEQRGLNPDPFSPDNRGAYLLGQALDLNERAPWSPMHLRQADPKAGIAAGTLYDQLKSFFAYCAAQADTSSSNETGWWEAVSVDWLRGSLQQDEIRT